MPYLFERLAWVQGNLRCSKVECLPTSKQFVEEGRLFAGAWSITDVRKLLEIHARAGVQGLAARFSAEGVGSPGSKLMKMPLGC